MRAFCWTCHRPKPTCFCASARPFASSPEFALIVHPDEVNSSVGTAWILRRSISNLKWIRSDGLDLDQNPNFLELVAPVDPAPDRVPLLLFPGEGALNLSHASDQEWRNLVPETSRPLFVVVDGTWTQALTMIRNSAILHSLPRITFVTDRLSEYGFKRQPHPYCLSSVEGVHRVIELMSERGWGSPPPSREHDQMIEIFRAMSAFQLRIAELARNHPGTADRDRKISELEICPEHPAPQHSPRPD